VTKSNPKRITSRGNHRSNRDSDLSEELISTFSFTVFNPTRQLIQITGGREFFLTYMSIREYIRFKVPVVPSEDDGMRLIVAEEGGVLIDEESF
jgi:hypothetical protein